MARPPSDHERLMRAFRQPATRRRAGVILASGLGALGALAAPVLLLPAAGVAIAMAGYEISDRRGIDRGLREVEAWGFPVEGYRAWLLADEPTFEIELRRTVDIQVIATSAAAIDPSLAVQRIADRMFRVIMRRIALPGLKPDAPAAFLGDRRLLHVVHDRLLAPLHADVGISRMRMGDRAELAGAPLALPAGPHGEDPEAAGGGMGAFRDAAMAAPPALQALVHAGKQTLALGTDARNQRDRALRVLYASGSEPSGVGTVIAMTLGGAVAVVNISATLIGFGAIGGLIAGIGMVIANNRRNARAVRSLVQWHGFPVEDYDAWLLSGRPLFDIELAGPVDHDWLYTKLMNIVAFSGEAESLVRWVLDVAWLDDRRVRVETRPTLIQPTRKLRPFYGGSHILFQQCMNDVLVPLHQLARIQVVRMGGEINRRV